MKVTRNWSIAGHGVPYVLVPFATVDHLIGKYTKYLDKNLQKTGHHSMSVRLKSSMMMIMVLIPMAMMRCHPFLVLISLRKNCKTYKMESDFA